MYLQIITPGHTVFEGDVESATFPGAKGSFQVLNNHAPLISSLTEGVLKYVSDGKPHEIIITGGVVETLNNTITALIEGVKE